MDMANKERTVLGNRKGEWIIGKALTVPAKNTKKLFCRCGKL